MHGALFDAAADDGEGVCCGEFALFSRKGKEACDVGVDDDTDD